LALAVDRTKAAVPELAELIRTSAFVEVKPLGYIPEGVLARVATELALALAAVQAIEEILKGELEQRSVPVGQAGPELQNGLARDWRPTASLR
jgi:hypothetical protein